MSLKAVFTCLEHGSCACACDIESTSKYEMMMCNDDAQ